MALEFDDYTILNAKIKVVGIGGAGGNAINRMVSANLQGVEFIAINTDSQALEHNQAHSRIQIGRNFTKGLGAGSIPERGRKAIEEDREGVVNALANSDMVFITAGMGGGTGTGASPVVAEIAKDLGALTVGIITKPFAFEGKKRMQNAEMGIEELKDKVDTLIVIQNERLLSIVEKQTTFTHAFKIADDILLQATKGISDVITVPGLINVDFADVQTIMRGMGDAIMGSGFASGQNRSSSAANQAISSPLLEGVSISGAMGVLINITGGPDMTLHEVNEACSIIHDAVGDDTHIIFGAVIDNEIRDEIRITVIATGFNKASMKKPQPAKQEYVSISQRQLERPAFIRKDKEKDSIKEELKRLKEQPPATPDELDIPTFIRKQMD